MPCQSFITHRFVTLGWMFMPALVTNRVQFFDTTPIVFIVLYCMLCAAITLKEYPWKMLKPINTYAFEPKSRADSVMFQQAFKYTRYGLAIQHVAIFGLVLETLVTIGVTVYRASGWAMLFAGIDSLLYVLLLLTFGVLTCGSPIYRAYVPRVYIRPTY